MSWIPNTRGGSVRSGPTSRAANHAVSQRSREIGVRIALGARGSDVPRVVLREGVRTVAVGLVLGTPAALGVPTAMRGVLYGVARTDTVGFVLLPLAVAGAALVACALPAGQKRSVTLAEKVRDLPLGASHSDPPPEAGLVCPAEEE